MCNTVSCRKALLKASLKCPKIVSIEGNKASKFPKIARTLSNQSFEHVVFGNLPGSEINERRRMGLQKQMSVDTNVLETERRLRGELRKQNSVDTDHRQKMFQVDLIKQADLIKSRVDLIKRADLIKSRLDLTKQVSIQSAPCTPTGTRRALDKRLKKEQGMTMLVNLTY